MTLIWRGSICVLQFWSVAETTGLTPVFHTVAMMLTQTERTSSTPIRNFEQILKAVAVTHGKRPLLSWKSSDSVKLLQILVIIDH